MTNTTGLSDLVPSESYLSQNYPNPFSGKTSTKLCVACKTRVKLEVYDSEGVNVNTPLDEEKEAGTYEIECVSRATIFPREVQKDSPPVGLIER